jgi:intracellular sulfur oxidation DsrE/DsrF family protein
MTYRRRLIATLAALAGAAGLAPAGARAEEGKAAQHHAALQVDENRADLMNLVLNNVANIAQHYADKGEAVALEIVAFGPGLTMLRADTSPVKARIDALAERMPHVVFSACENTMRAVEKAEGKPVQLIPQARTVPAGVVRLIELQEQGWSYIRT